MPCTAAPITTLKAWVNGREHDAPWIHSVPMGFGSDRLPLSLQIVGPEWSEAKILAITHAYEAATPEIHARRPECG